MKLLIDSLELIIMNRIIDKDKIDKLLLLIFVCRTLTWIIINRVYYDSMKV